MVVSSRYDEQRKAWHLQWRCQGKLQLRVNDADLDGDTEAAERVARRLQRFVQEAADQSDQDLFMSRRDAFIADELGVMNKHFGRHYRRCCIGF